MKAETLRQLLETIPATAEVFIAEAGSGRLAEPQGVRVCLDNEVATSVLPHAVQIPDVVILWPQAHRISLSINGVLVREAESY